MLNQNVLHGTMHVSLEMYIRPVTYTHFDKHGCLREWAVTSQCQSTHQPVFPLSTHVRTAHGEGLTRGQICDKALAFPWESTSRSIKSRGSDSAHTYTQHDVQLGNHTCTRHWHTSAKVPPRNVTHLSRILSASSLRGFKCARNAAQPIQQTIKWYVPKETKRCT